MKILDCPCGRPIDNLLISEGGDSGKYGFVSGDCCGEWNIEFRLNYEHILSKQAKESALKAWNNAPRDILKGNLIRDLEYKCDVMEFMLKTAYCQLKNIETIFDFDEYEEWRDSLTDRYNILFKD